MLIQRPQSRLRWVRCGIPRISVRNSGEPVPQALSYIFELKRRYSHYSAEKRGSVAGLGPGLFIVSGNVAKDGVWMEVELTEEGNDSRSDYTLFIRIRHL